MIKIEIKRPNVFVPALLIPIGHIMRSQSGTIRLRGRFTLTNLETFDSMDVEYSKDMYEDLGLLTIIEDEHSGV